MATVILEPDQYQARIKFLCKRKICIAVILALFVGIVIIWINSKNISDKELVTGFRDVRRGQVDRSIGDAQAIPRALALIGNNASTEAHRPSLFGDFEKMAGDDQRNRIFPSSVCPEGVCPNAGDDPNPNAKRFRNAKLAIAVSARDFSIGKRGGEFLWKDRSGSGDSAVDIDDTSGKPATLDAWQGHFIGVMERIRATFPNAKVARDAILFADELVRQHR